MTENNLAISVGVILLVWVHNYAFFELVDRMLDERRVAKWVVLGICLMNGVAASLTLPQAQVSYTRFFLSLALMLVIEFFICFRNSIVGILTCSTAIILHILCLRAVVVSIMALVQGVGLYDIAHVDNYPEISLIITLFVHTIVIVVIIRIIKSEYLKIINQNKEFSLPLCLLSSLFLSYMIYNGVIYDNAEIAIAMEVPQIVLPLVLLAGLYMGVWMMIAMVKLHGYKDKHQELEEKINRDRVYKSALMNRAIAVLEINCTHDKLKTYIRNGKIQRMSEYELYTDFVHAITESAVHPTDRDMVIEYLLPQNMIRSLKNGISRYVYDYRSLNSEQKYGWYRCEITTSLNEAEEVMAIATISQIQLEKEEELKLRYRAERDPLTSACNKEMIEVFTDEYLSEGGTGVLFMFDLDNFKGINDTFGHTYGDEVLKEAYNKVQGIFREHDIIGRVGGDEFVVFMKGSTSIDIIKEKARKMCDKIAKEHVASDGKKILVTSSIGIVVARSEGEKYQRLYDAADTAMYVSKNSGKNKFTLYDSHMNKSFYSR